MFKQVEEKFLKLMEGGKDSISLYKTTLLKKDMIIKQLAQKLMAKETELTQNR
jgi:hypothetical protein